MKHTKPSDRQKLAIYMQAREILVFHDETNYRCICDAISKAQLLLGYVTDAFGYARARWSVKGGILCLHGRQ